MPDQRDAESRAAAVKALANVAASLFSSSNPQVASSSDQADATGSIELSVTAPVPADTKLLEAGGCSNLPDDAVSAAAEANTKSTPTLTEEVDGCQRTCGALSWDAELRELVIRPLLVAARDYSTDNR